MKIIIRLTIVTGLFFATLQASAQEKISITEKTTVAPVLDTLTLKGVEEMKKKCAENSKKACCLKKATAETVESKKKLFKKK